MFSPIYICKQKSEESDKTDRKQELGPKTILIVMVVIFAVFALLLPFRFCHGNKHPDVVNAYFGTWYNTTDSTAASNETRIYVKVPIKGYIKLELDRAETGLAEAPHDVNFTSNTKVTVKGDRALPIGSEITRKACTASDGGQQNCRSRHKRSAKTKKKENTYTEQQYYNDAYDAYLKCLEEKNEKYFEGLASHPNVVLGEEETVIILKCNMW